jgi:hypothetical protein
LRTIAQPRPRPGCGSGRLGVKLLDVLGADLDDDVAAEAELQGQFAGLRVSRCCKVGVSEKSEETPFVRPKISVDLDAGV